MNGALAFAGVLAAVVVAGCSPAERDADGAGDADARDRETGDVEDVLEDTEPADTPETSVDTTGEDTTEAAVDVTAEDTIEVPDEDAFDETIEETLDAAIEDTIEDALDAAIEDTIEDALDAAIEVANEGVGDAGADLFEPDAIADGDADAAEVVDDTAEPQPAPPIGLNDVTFLLPLPASPTTALLDGPAMLPPDLFERLVTTPGDLIANRADFVVVAVRFDLCDRVTPTACPAASEPVLRVVLQPQTPGWRAVRDVAVHVFFAIDVAETADLVSDLRALATQGAVQDPRPSRPVTRPLEVNLLLGDPTSAYAQHFVALVSRHANPDRLFRMTTFGQVGFESQRWHMRGLVRDSGDTFTDIFIPGIGVSTQEIRKVGQSSFAAVPTADLPVGFGLALDAGAFQVASTDAQDQALAALAEADHPQRTTADTIPCVTCHASTFLADQRGLTVGLDPAAFPGRFTARFDLSPLGTRHGFTLRALGYFNDAPLVSRRVAAESAVVVDELEARFPR